MSISVLDLVNESPLKTTEAFTVQAKVIDASGKIISSFEAELIKVKTDFISRLIAFFKMLFGELPIIEQ